MKNTKRQFLYVITLCSGLLLTVTRCGSSSNNNNTAAPTCAAGQVLYSANNTCLQACGDGVTMGLVNGSCQVVNGSAAIGTAGATCMVNGYPGMMTTMGCGFPVNTTNGQCQAMVYGAYYPCTGTTATGAYGAYGTGYPVPGYGYGGNGYGGYYPSQNIYRGNRW